MKNFALAIVLLSAGCQAPADGVLSIAFLLQTPPASETRVVPPEAETGIAPSALGRAAGRCELDPPARRASCTMTGLPPLPNAGTSRYRLSLLLWYAPLPPRFDARALDRDPGGRDPDGPPVAQAPPLPRAPLGIVTPDAFGNAERVAVLDDVPLDQVVGGELTIEVDREGAEPVRYVAIDGRVGNQTEGATGSPSPPAPPTGHGH